LYVSTNKGATWAIAGTLPNAVDNGRLVHVPFADNPTGQVVYVGTTGNWAVDQSFVSTDGGASWTAINGGEATGIKRHGIESYTQDRQTMYMWQVDDETTDIGTLYTSDDAGATWAAATGTNLAGRVQATSGFPYADGQFYIVTTTKLMTSIDRGETWIDKTGDFTAFDFDFADGFGSSVILPVWTE
jgi:photosystem II stability/assembly factor-like uncharacterized protein